MQTYAPDDAPRAAPVLAAHCGRSAPGGALARPTCRRPPSPPSRSAPGMHHAPTDVGRIAAHRPPWLSGCAGSHCVARFRLARLPPVRPRKWLPKSRRWRDGDLWISRPFSPSLHHECRLAGVRCNKPMKNQNRALSRCRICYLLLTLFAPFNRLLPSSEMGRQWHTFRSASTATALLLIGC